MAFPVDESRVEMAEEQLGRQLPSGLRERLLVANGGEIEADGLVWYLHPVFDDTDRRRLRRTATSHIVHTTREAHSMLDGVLPEAAVLVANNGSGDYLLLLPNLGDPHWWDHETGELTPVTTDWSQRSADAVRHDG